jgi:SAM-dependent methyltransferase
MNRARQNQESYDRIADQFLERHRDRAILLPWMRSFAALLPSRGVVLDLGAGPCQDSAQLRGLGLQVTSLDRSRQMLTVAASQFPGPRVQADLRHLPVRDGSLSGVWACACLLHLDRVEVAPALAGIARALVPGGGLFVSVKDGEGERCDTSAYGSDVPRWFTYWSGEGIDAALRGAGFEIVDSVTRAGPNDVWHVRLARCAAGSK